jgi:hypothetical protein
VCDRARHLSRQAAKHLYEGIDFFVGIIESKGRTDRALESKMALGPAVHRVARHRRLSSVGMDCC